MNNGHANADVLRWAGRLLSSDDLRRHWRGQREVVVPAQAIITPLASEELRTNGVHTRREDSSAKSSAKKVGVAEDRPNALVQAALKALERDGIELARMPGCPGPTCDWARGLAECIASGTCLGGAVFCSDPGLVCCVANKVVGLRAAAVCTVPQAARALLTFGANLLAIEMPGRTYFEIRQILRNLSTAVIDCPNDVACTLKELEHAHR